MDLVCVRVRRFEIDLIKYALQRAAATKRVQRYCLREATTLNSKIKLYRLQTKLFRCVAEDESPLLSASTRPAIMAGVIPRITARSVN